MSEFIRILLSARMKNELNELMSEQMLFYRWHDRYLIAQQQLFGPDVIQVFVQ